MPNRNKKSANLAIAAIAGKGLRLISGGYVGTSLIQQLYHLELLAQDGRYDWCLPTDIVLIDVKALI